MKHEQLQRMDLAERQRFVETLTEAEARQMLNTWVAIDDSTFDIAATVIRDRRTRRAQLRRGTA